MYICYNTLPDVRESGFQNPENFYLYVESGIPGVESRIQDHSIPLDGAKHQRILSPESWTCLASLVFVLV